MKKKEIILNETAGKKDDDSKNSESNGQLNEPSKGGLSLLSAYSDSGSDED